MRPFIVLCILFLSLSGGALAAEQAPEKPEVDSPNDPIGDIITAPFKIIGGIFSGGGGAVYDPDVPRAYWYRDRYSYWDDPYYYDHYYYDRYYRYHYPYWKRNYYYYRYRNPC